MDKTEIRNVWAAYLEVQEAKKKLDPVGKEDGDIDNDGDEDSSDEYLAKRRKAIGKAVAKEESEESPYPTLDKKKREKKGSNLEDAGGPAAKLKGESTEESPYPTLDKKKREKKGSNLEPAGGPSDNLKGSMKEGEMPVALKANAEKMKKGKLPNQKEEDDVKEWSGKEGNRRVAGGDKRKLKEEEKEECPKCQGEGCDHCDDTGYHVKAESLDLSIFSEEELARIEEEAGEPFMSTASAGEKKFYNDHQKSDKKLETMDDEWTDDGANAGKAVKAQASNRGADNLSNGDTKVKG